MRPQDPSVAPIGPDSKRRHHLGAVDTLLALPLLAMTIAGLVQFALLLATADTLRSAALAAGREARLPKATCQSIRAAACRRLAGSNLANAIDPVHIQVNGRSARAGRAPQSGDRVTVELSVRAGVAAPDLLGLLGIYPAGELLKSRLVVRVP